MSINKNTLINTNSDVVVETAGRDTKEQIINAIDLIKIIKFIKMVRADMKRKYGTDNQIDPFFAASVLLDARAPKDVAVCGLLLESAYYGYIKEIRKYFGNSVADLLFEAVGRGKGNLYEWDIQAEWGYLRSMKCEALLLRIMLLIILISKTTNQIKYREFFIELIEKLRTLSYFNNYYPYNYLFELYARQARFLPEPEKPENDDSCDR